MSRLSKRVETLRAKINELEGELEIAEAKQRRQLYKRDRKQLRKKLAKDSIYRGMYAIMCRMEQAMFEPHAMSHGTVIMNLLRSLD